MKAEPVKNEDGSRKQFMFRVDGKPFRCACGCNVFHKPDASRPEIVRCNACEATFETEDA